MTKCGFTLIAMLVSPAAVLAQTGWSQFPQSSHFSQSGWYFSNAQHSETLEGQSGPVYGHPISANEVRTSTQTLGEGSHITHTETEHFYRDGQGRMRTETATGAIVYDPVAGYTYELDSDHKTYIKRASSAHASITIAAAAHRTSTSSSSHNGVPAPLFKGPSGPTEELPAQILNGISAKGSRVTITIPAGAIGNDHELKVINERWYSDDLKLLLKTTNSDPRFGTSTYELQDIIQAEPAASLFQIPSDYTEKR